MSLYDEVSEKRREIRTDGYAMSIGEWIALYENKELDIHPEFQRFYRWTPSQKTNLIESILLGIPIPPIFVSQRSDGVWDVVDGLQRLSTIYQFVGVLKDINGNNIEPLELTGTKYLPSLMGKKWNNPDNIDNSLTQEIRLIIKRSKINVSVILKESDEAAKYDLFQRLNTGGTNLSPQEVRNCILVMLNKDFFRWLQELSQYEPFRECIALSDRPIDESYDIELALRFVVFSKINEADLSNIGDVGIYLTEKMSAIAVNKKFDQQYWDILFKKTFDMLVKKVGDKAFKRFSKEKSKFLGGFLLSQFEVVAFGLAYNIENVTESLDIENSISSIWLDQQYTEWSGAGMTATRRLPRLIPYGRRLFGNVSNKD